MNPKFIDDMSWEMGEVYGAVCDRIMINLAKYFPYIEGALADDEAVDAFKYQAKKLAQMGQVHTDTVKIIAQSLRGEEKAIRDALSAAILDALKDADPILRKAAEQGLLYGPGLLPPEVSPGQFNAFTQYYKQSMDKMNLVNTVMLESTDAAYQSCVSDITSKIRRTQSILNVGAGEMVTGVSSLNDVVNSAVQKMVDNGLTGFVDHAGRRWRPETYVAMDMRTTLHNTANQAVWERCDEYGSDIYQVSTHNGARPLCYPWQAKLISRHDMVRDVEDIDGYTAHVYAQSETSYGQAAGLFGVNCGHYPTPFIPGFSALRGNPQPEEENERVYEESQKQRELERKLRKEKLDLDVMKARGCPDDMIKAQRARVDKASGDIQAFCDETGRTRRRNREYTPVNATWPDKGDYDAASFPTDTRDRLDDWFGSNRDGGDPPRGNIHIGPDNVPPQTGARAR